MHNHDILVIGASAGGIEALSRLLAQLPADLPASVFIAQHTTPYDPGYMAQIFQRVGPLNASLAIAGEPIRQGHIFIAPPDHHLLVKQGYVELSRGPRENRARPAIDVLFRSAAIAYTSRVIGVLLTGLLDDGTAGLWAIKQCGGITIAQDPNDAAYPAMPRSAIEHNVADYVSTITEMGALLNQLVRVRTDIEPAVPEDLVLESRFVEHVNSDVAGEQRVGTLASTGCPECGGPLWKIDTDRPLRYRCHMGHGYTARNLLADQDKMIEQALWVALRTMEEQNHLLSTMAANEQRAGRADTAKLFNQRQQEAQEAIDVIRALLEGGKVEQGTLADQGVSVSESVRPSNARNTR